MKTQILFVALIALVMAAANLPAQVLQTQFTFNGTNGQMPLAGLTLGKDGNFYGTTYDGGNLNLGGGEGLGTIFKITPNGALTTLVSFNGTNGASPQAGLTLGGDGNFYGTTAQGGNTNLDLFGLGLGTIFKVTPCGTLTTLVSFNGTNGINPQAKLTLGSDGNFYGTTGNIYQGGGDSRGTIFKMTTNGTLTTLVSFNLLNGASPQAELTLGSDGNFYGTTQTGGNTNLGGGYGYGTVFKVTPNGTLTTLVSFNLLNGAQPLAGLTLGNDGNFYGTTTQGGNTNLYWGSGLGTVFKVTTNGTLTTLVSFNYATGSNPYAALTLGSDGNFYGTTYKGGSSGDGTIFKVTTNGTLTTLVSFNGTNGSYPQAALTVGSDGNFYGTTQTGGSFTNLAGVGLGTVFRFLLSFPVITSQPQTMASVLGDDATFIVVATNPDTLDYQWYFSNPTLQTTAQATAQISNGFVYGSIVFSGGSGYTTVPQVQFIGGGGGSGASGTATVNNGQVTSITMTNAGNGYTSLPTVLIDPPNGLLIGQTNATLNLNAITTNNFGNYFVVISNFCGSVTSCVAALTQVYTPSISQQPTNQIVSFGSGVGFSVTAAGTPPIGYQWWMVAGQQSNATAVPVVINGFVLTANVTSGGLGYLAVPSVQFIGGSGSGATGTAMVSNLMLTAINMSSAGSGYTTPPLIQIDAPTAISLSGQTDCNLLLAAVTDANAGNYFVVVTNNFGSVTSSPAVLTINGAAPQYMTLATIGGGLQLQFIGTPNHPYILETATNLVSPINWQPVLTNSADANGNWIFTLTNTPNVPACFYRAAGQ